MIELVIKDLLKLTKISVTVNIQMKEEIFSLNFILI